MARADAEGARQIYEDLAEARGRTTPAILAFWLAGSRGMGRPTEHSD